MGYLYEVTGNIRALNLAVRFATSEQFSRHRKPSAHFTLTLRERPRSSQQQYNRAGLVEW
jgi:hypothetical protein